MKKQILLLLCSLSYYFSIIAQTVPYTANEQVLPFDGNFGYGTNMGTYWDWFDDQLADIAVGNESLDIPGVGINVLRPSLPEVFVEGWGYDIRINVFQHYKNLGAVNNCVFVGYSSEEHRDKTEYCPGQRTEIFENMYEPIWDNGEFGTPVNEENYYASYIYQLVTRYKDYIRFWEIWNEPDFAFDYSPALPPGEPGNWWDNDPEPCSSAFFAPVERYVRLLRISWEVIKSVNPDAYVTTGGIAYDSYLDAILRNTDNPEDGSVTAEYPLTGGAYFDVLSYHTYPHFDNSIRYWDNSIQDFVYTRHSDAARKGIIARKDELEKVLYDRGYDGRTYPEKLWIITEVNIPRKNMTGQSLASEEAQSNFLIKAAVTCQMNKIDQMYVYQLGEIATEAEAENEFALMGFYKDLNSIRPYQQQVNPSGIAFKTMSDALLGKKYDPIRTQALGLPEGVAGAAFEAENGEYTYCLWAETQTDMSEEALFFYEMPDILNTKYLNQWEWDYATTKEEHIINTNQIRLTGAPVFLFETEDTPAVSSFVPLQSYPTFFDDYILVEAYLSEAKEVTFDLVTIDGKLLQRLGENISLPEGVSQLRFNEHLPDVAGVYVITMTYGDARHSVRVVKK